MSDSPGSPDRILSTTLAEYNALRAELLAHSSSQITLIGLGTTTVGVVLGLAISQPGNRALFVLVPILSIVVVLAYGGLAYRIICIGQYIGTVLWPTIQRTAGRSDDVPSWETWLATLESKGKDRLLAGIVELPLLFLLLLIGFVAAVMADGIPVWIRVVEAGFVVLAATAGYVLCRRGRVPPGEPHA